MGLLLRDNFYDFDKKWNELYTPSAVVDGTFSPRVNICEMDNRFEITAELPGVSKDDLSVELDDGVLTIEASTGSDETRETPEGVLIRRERCNGRYIRSFRLRKNVHDNDIDASFTDGVLTLTVKKQKSEEIKARNIEVQ